MHSQAAGVDDLTVHSSEAPQKEAPPGPAALKCVPVFGGGEPAREYRVHTRQDLSIYWREEASTAKREAEALYFSIRSQAFSSGAFSFSAMSTRSATEAARIFRIT